MTFPPNTAHNPLQDATPATPANTASPASTATPATAAGSAPYTAEQMAAQAAELAAEGATAPLTRQDTGTADLGRLADFIHEVGMLRHTPRTGYQFLGTGAENVAEHSYRTAVLGYVLAGMAGADRARTVFMCLFHDLAEARTGDFNYVNHRYNTCNTRQALTDAVQGTGLAADILPLWEEWEASASVEALLAHDADQLDLVFNLKCESEKGNTEADAWIESALCRLKTPEGCALGQVATVTPPGQWWRHGVDASWWAHRR